MSEYGLSPHDEEIFAYVSLGELFQPFLLEYIRLQEDQFIKYAHKIYDVSRINQLAEEIAHMIEHSRVVLLSMSSLDAVGLPGNGNTSCGNAGVTSPNGSFNNYNYNNIGGLSQSGGGMSGVGGGSNMGLPNELVDKYSIDLKSTKAIYDLENYYSASVTDFFTIMHELLQTLLSFDTNDSKANMPHQMGFVNLIKSKLLGYSAHVKKEFQKIYNQARSIFFY